MIKIVFVLFILLPFQAQADIEMFDNFVAEEANSFSDVHENLKIAIYDKSDTFKRELEYVQKIYPSWPPVEVFWGDVDNLTLFKTESTFALVVNQDFIDKNTKDGSIWIVRGYLAHELGHVIANDLLFDRDRKLEEKKADQFAGELLQALGATSEQAKEAYELLPDETKGPYPSKAERLNAVASGWAIGCEKDPKCIVKLGEDPTLTEQDPFTTTHDFQYYGWTTMFHTSLLNVVREGQKYKKEASLVFVLRNEAQSDLRKIVFSHFNFKDLKELNLLAWKAEDGSWPSAFGHIQPYRKFQLLGSPARSKAMGNLVRELFEHDTGFIDEARFRWNEDGQLETLVKSEGSIQYLDDKDTFRFTDISEVISPGESIVVLVQYLSKTLDLVERRGKRDWIGHLTPFPARVSLLGVNFLGFESSPFTSVKQTVDTGDGDAKQDHVDSKFDSSDFSLVVDHNFLPQHSRQELSWRWKQTI